MKNRIFQCMGKISHTQAAVCIESYTSTDVFVFTNYDPLTIQFSTCNVYIWVAWDLHVSKDYSDK